MKVSCRIDASSLQAFQMRLHEAERRVHSGGVEGMDAAATAVFNSSQAKVPRVTGALADSGRITGSDSPSNISRTISYGGSNRNPRTGKATSSYAAYKHETPNRMGMQGYKWLENALREYGKEQYLTTLAQHMRNIL